MFDHVKFGVSDYEASKAFFLKALEPLGVTIASEGPPTYGVELNPPGKASLYLYQIDEKPAHPDEMHGDRRDQRRRFHFFAAPPATRQPGTPRANHSPTPSATSSRSGLSCHTLITCPILPPSSGSRSTHR